MKAIDRVMAAYAKTHKLTDEQSEAVRRELSLFIDQFLDGHMPDRSPINSQAGRNRPAGSPDCRTHRVR
jgi:hypothetical protein